MIVVTNRITDKWNRRPGDVVSYINK